MALVSHCMRAFCVFSSSGCDLVQFDHQVSYSLGDSGSYECASYFTNSYFMWNLASVFLMFFSSFSKSKRPLS